MTRPLASSPAIAIGLAWALASCGPQTDRDTGSARTETGTGTPSSPEVQLSVSEPVLCAQPERRTERYYDRSTLPSPETDDYDLTGAGVVAEDFDGDGWVDLLVFGQHSSQLWRNTTTEPGATLQFEDATADWLTGLDLQDAVGGVGVDLFPDGRVDVVVTRFGHPNRLLRNTGTRFEDRTPASWTDAWPTQTASLDDIDGDGDLDLFFGSYGDVPQSNTDIPPSEPSELYRNDGEEQWTALSENLPQAIHDGYVFMAGFYRFDERTVPDLLVFNDFGRAYPSQRLRFEFDGTLATEAWHPNAEDMGVGVGDLNGDSVPDFLITSAATISAYQSGEALGLRGQWIESASAWGIEVDPYGANQVFGWAAEWADLDNDADLDGLALMGRWNANAFTEPQQDALWEHVAPLTFEERASSPEWAQADDGAARGLALADLNRDGWLDLVKRQVLGPTLIDASRCGDAGWLSVTLQQPGDNPRGIGSRIRVRRSEGSDWQTRWLTAGGSGMYGGGPPQAWVGLGDAETVTLEVTWPDGSVHTFEGLTARTHVTVVRP